MTNVQPRKNHLPEEDRNKYIKDVCNIRNGFDASPDHAIHMEEEGKKYRGDKSFAQRFEKKNG